MRKEPGVYFVEFYDELGHKFNTVLAKNFGDSVKIADGWEAKKEGNSAVASRILYNTKMKRSKLI